MAPVMNKFFGLLATVILLASPAFAQSISDEMSSEIIVETLAESEFSVPAPYVEIQLEPVMSDQAQTAVLRGLDRINGTVQNIVLLIGETVTYERLKITLIACRYPKGDINSDAFAQLSIRDIREDEPRFTGWMFASSPALSALDHPRYDVWVLSCKSS
ncbi:MAG: DUF2155 domain-containing protein [Gammaproteobacteria bacterium]|nr:DUF2155 domain-containing protein [Gammaproteobacteria bacterium]